jgi:hypothetical protein
MWGFEYVVELSKMVVSTGREWIRVRFGACRVLNMNSCFGADII